MDSSYESSRASIALLWPVSLNRIRRSQHRIGLVPSASESPPDRRLADSENSSPFDDGPALSVDSDKSVSPCVSGLFFRCCPAAIGFAISLVVVLSVQGSSVWSLSHVLQEVGEVFPSLAYGNSPSSIAKVPFATWLVTSLKKPCPSVVRLRDTTGGRVSVPEFQHCGIFGSDAATGSGASPDKLPASNNGRVSALTSAFPTCLLPWTILGSFQDSKASEYLTSEIDSRTSAHCISPYASNDKLWQAGGVAGFSGRRPSHAYNIQEFPRLYNSQTGSASTFPEGEAG